MRKAANKLQFLKELSVSLKYLSHSSIFMENLEKNPQIFMMAKIIFTSVSNAYS